MKKSQQTSKLHVWLLVSLLCLTTKDMTKVKEIWKDAPNYKGYYQVSNLGRVFSLVSKRYLALCINSAGYFIVVFTKDGLHKKTFSVHRLVAELFIPNPLNLPQVNHKKGIKTDNRVSELEWTNQSGNQKHAYEFGLQKPSETQKLAVANYCKSNYSKKVIQHDLNGNLIAEYYSASEAARVTGGFQGNISKVCRGEMKKHHNYIWRYA